MPAIGIIANFSSIKKLRMEQFRIVVTEFGKQFLLYLMQFISVSGRVALNKLKPNYVCTMISFTLFVCL